MATIEQKLRCEHRARGLVADQGLPQPDHVEYGGTGIWLLWRERKLAVRIDIDDESDPAPVVLVDEPHPSQPPLAPERERPGDGYDPLMLREAEPSPN